MRIILIHGLAQGKSFLAECIAAKYRAVGVAYERVDIGQVGEAEKSFAKIRKLRPEVRFVIATTNLPAKAFVGINFFQVIEVQKGRPLKHSDFFDTPHDGFGLSECGFIGMPE